MKTLTKLFATALLTATGTMATADETGKDVFMQYCATCHGETADGKGPMTDLLTVEVPDLSQLSANNDGAFPMLEVIHIIDGRTGMRAHGGPMPVYGAIFDDEVESPGPYGAPLYTRGKVLSIAYYLESLQK